jgi:putative addiction module killer protein
MRIDYGPGYRVYFAQEGTTICLHLLGGDKRNQDADVKKAKALWETYKRENNHEK